MVPLNRISVTLATFLLGQTCALGARAAEDPAVYPNLVGGALGIVVPVSEKSAYVDSPVGLWGDRSTTWSLGAFYLRKLTPSFRVGTILEMESVTAKFHEGQASGRRTSLGVTWLGHYPDGPLSMELGGVTYLGMLTPGSVTPASDTHWNTLKGIEFGVVVGPSVEIEHLHFALHWEPLFSWFSGDTPEGVTLTDPRIRLKVGYAF